MLCESSCNSPVVLVSSCEVGGLRPVPWQTAGASSVQKERERIPGERELLRNTAVAFEAT